MLKGEYIATLVMLLLNIACLAIALLLCAFIWPESLGWAGLGLVVPLVAGAVINSAFFSRKETKKQKERDASR